MFTVHLLSSWLMMQTNPDLTVPAETEPVVSKEEIAKLEAENNLASKYLFIGTLVATPPTLVGLTTGVLAMVGGVLFAYSALKLYQLDDAPRRADYDQQSQLWRAALIFSGLFLQSCATVSFFSCAGGAIAFLGAMKAMDEIDNPD